jgi:hypothetical protein
VSLVNGSGRVAYDDTQAMLDLLADTRPAMRADVSPLADALNGLGRDASVFAILSAYDVPVLSELAVRPRLPGSAVVLLLKPWTFGRLRLADDPSVDPEASWQASADALRLSGWRVVGAEAGSQLANLWPAMLTSTSGVWR